MTNKLDYFGWNPNGYFNRSDDSESDETPPPNGYFNDSESDETSPPKPKPKQLNGFQKPYKLSKELSNFLIVARPHYNEDLRI